MCAVLFKFAPFALVQLIQLLKFAIRTQRDWRLIASTLCYKLPGAHPVDPSGSCLSLANLAAPCPVCRTGGSRRIETDRPSIGALSLQYSCAERMGMKKSDPRIKVIF